MKTSQPPSATAWISGTIMDVRYALRAFARKPALATMATITLALCIGANTAVFSVIYGLMLKPLPFHDAGRIVSIYNNFPKNGVMKAPSSVAQYIDYREHATSYEKLGLWMQYPCTLGTDEALQRVAGSRATADMFDVLGVTPVLGRFFTLENSRPGSDKVAVLTHSYWESAFHGRADVVGETLTVDGEKLEIVGVAPRAIETLDARVKFLQPYPWPAERMTPQARLALGIGLFGRLKPGVTPAMAQAEGALLEKQFLTIAAPPVRAFIEQSNHQVGVGQLQAERVDAFKSTLLLLQGSALFVLLIGCFNVANLLLARTNGRLSELAIRFSLGAGRGLLARQLLVEALVLALGGAFAGIVLGWGAIRTVNHYRAALFPNLNEFVLDWGVLGATALAALAVAVFVALVPLLHVVRSNIAGLLQSSTRGASGSRSLRYFSTALIVSQVGVAVVLATGAGLLVQSFVKALAVRPGLEPAKVVVGRVALPARYQRDADSRALQGQLAMRLREIPGVDAVALATDTPFQGKVGAITAKFKDVGSELRASSPTVYHLGVSAEYFDTLKIQLIEGRSFQPSDHARHQTAFIVDEKFAQAFFPGRSAVGQRFFVGRPPQKEDEWPTIVGVVRSVPHNGVEDRTGIPFIYFPLEPARPGALTLLVHSRRSVADTIAAMRATLRAIDPTIPLFDTGPLADIIENSYTNRRAVMVLLSAFAGLALFLCAIGIYGVLAYDVSQRRREIGIRGAIGASRGRIAGLFLSQGIWKTLLGLAGGVAGAVALRRYITSLLYDVPATNPAVYVAVALLLLLVAVVASVLPARAAAKIDPIVSLRGE